MSNDIKLFSTIKKHEIVRARRDRVILEHGGRNVAKTRNRIVWTLEILKEFTRGGIIWCRATNGEIVDSIWSIFMEILDSYPVWAKAFVEKIDNSNHAIFFKNSAFVKTKEINVRSDPSFSRLKNSLLTTSIVFDDAAGFLTKQSFDAVYGSLGKQKGVNEIELHKSLVASNFAKNRLDEYKGRIEFQKELEQYNREILENEFSFSEQQEIIEAYQMPAQLIVTLNPVCMGYWHTDLLQKARNNQPGYFEMQYDTRDNIKHLDSGQKEYIKELKEEGGQAYQMYVVGELPEFSDDLDLFHWKAIDQYYENGKGITQSKFFDSEGKLYSNYRILGFLDPAELGMDVGAICLPVFRDLTNYEHYVFSFEYSKEGKTDSDFWRKYIPEVLEKENCKEENFGIDKQGNKVSYFLKKDGLQIKEFTGQATTGIGKQETAIDFIKGNTFVDQRAEAYWHLKQLGEKGKLFFCFKRHMRLDQELQLIRRVYRDDGAIQIIKKEKIRRLNKSRSTDFADCLAGVCIVDKIFLQVEFEIESYFADEF